MAVVDGCIEAGPSSWLNQQGWRGNLCPHQLRSQAACPEFNPMTRPVTSLAVRRDRRNGQRLRLARSRAELSLAGLGGLCGVAAQQIDNLEEASANPTIAPSRVSRLPSESIRAGLPSGPRQTSLRRITVAG